MEPPPPPRIHIHRNGQNFGPYSLQEINTYLAERRLSLQDTACAEGSSTWTTLAVVLNIPAQTESRIEDNVAVRLAIPVGTSFSAIAASYLGLFSVLLFPAPFALIAGIIAIKDIRKSRQTDRPKYGMGRSIFGVIMGAIFTVPLIFLLIVWLINLIQMSAR